jgi:hypothetical protein
MKERSYSSGPSYHFSTDIPEFYEETVLRIVPCNPHQRYVYWELPSEIRRKCTALKLRVHLTDAGTNETETTEYQLDSQSTYHYVTLAYPTLEYRYELLAVYADKSMEVLCSNIPQPSRQTHPVDSADIVFRATAIEHEEIPKKKQPTEPLHNASDADETITVPHKPDTPSSWALGEMYSS